MKRPELVQICVGFLFLRLPELSSPRDVDWTLQWHEIPQHWNERVKFLTPRHGLKIWSVACLGKYLKFVNYVTMLPFCQESDGLFEH